MLECELSTLVSSPGFCSSSGPPEEAVDPVSSGPPEEADDPVSLGLPEEADDPVSSGPPEEADDPVSSGPPEEAVDLSQSLWDISPNRVSVSKSELVVELVSLSFSGGPSPIRVNTHSSILLLSSCDWGTPLSASHTNWFILS